MGKVKRARNKAHIAAVKASTSGNRGKPSVSETTEVMEDDVTVDEEYVMKSNIFEGLDLSKYNLKTQLPEFDTQSAITSKSLKGLHLKKKDKKKLRHELWIQKLNAIDAAKKKAQDKKRKQQTPVVGDIRALGDALPTLELLLKGSTGPNQNRKEEEKPRGIQKEKKRKKQMMDDIAIFKQVIKHPAFQENPTSTISQHLQNRQKQEDMEGT